jgi:hypothetical protein
MYSNTFDIVLPMYIKISVNRQKIGKSNNLNIFESNQTKEPKQDSKNRIRLLMTEGD